MLYYLLALMALSGTLSDDTDWGTVQSERLPTFVTSPAQEAVPRTAVDQNGCRLPSYSAECQRLRRPCEQTQARSKSDCSVRYLAEDEAEQFRWSYFEDSDEAPHRGDSTIWKVRVVQRV